MKFVRKLIRKLTPESVFSLYHLILAILASLFYRFPSRKLKVIGITGTDGKSSVVELVTQILLSSGYKVGSVSSIQFRIGDKTWLNKLRVTMPGRFKLQNLLRKMVKAGCQYAVLEVTSEGIKQYRHWGIDFDVAVLTNISPEHIESHGSFEKYREAKAKLFQSLSNHSLKVATVKISIVNLDDENAEYFLGFEAEEKYGFAINSKFSTRQSFSEKNLGGQVPNSKFQISNIVEAADIKLNSKGVKFRVKDTQFRLHLLGRFNIYNALAVVCVGLSQGIGLETIKRALEEVKGIPGRMELVDGGQPFTVIVDYAHTPAALEKVYQTVEKLKVKSSSRQSFPKKNLGGQELKVIGVLGATGGGRDKWKRPVLGKIAAKYCQYIVLTTEDPYSENPIKIIEDIESGFSQIPKYEKIPDRRQAIRKALLLAEPDDIVVVTGKGCEPWMIVDGRKIVWDDRKAVREELGKIFNYFRFHRESSTKSGQ